MMYRYEWARYKPHYACFRCRKGFKRRRLADVCPEGVERPAQCPNCREAMVEMGYAFRPPRQANRRAWRVVEMLRRAGVTFDSDAGPKPWEARDVEAYLALVASHRDIAWQR